MGSYVDEVAEQLIALGMEPEIRTRLGYHTLVAVGEVEGERVQVDAAFQGYREQSWVLMQSRLRRPLDLGLHVRRTMLSLGTGIAVDFPGFTDEHHVAADEPSRARELLTPEICKKIVAVADLGGDIDLDDGRAEVRQTMGFNELRPTLFALTRITSALTEHYATLLPAGSLRAAVEAWREYAAREGLRFQLSPLAMTSPRVDVQTSRLGANRYATDVTMRLEEPLGTGIAIRPATLEERLWSIFAADDVQIGDAPFDRAFTIAARDPELAAMVLDASVREQLMKLRKEGDLHLADGGMTLRTTHHQDVPEALELMRGILDGVRQNARDAGRRGPYR